MKKRRVDLLIKYLIRGFIFVIGFYFIYNLMSKDTMSILESIEITIILGCVGIIIEVGKAMLKKIKDIMGY